MRGASPKRAPRSLLYTRSRKDGSLVGTLQLYSSVQAAVSAAAAQEHSVTFHLQAWSGEEIVPFELADAVSDDIRQIIEVQRRIATRTVPDAAELSALGKEFPRASRLLDALPPRQRGS